MHRRNLAVELSQSRLRGIVLGLCRGKLCCRLIQRILCCCGLLFCRIECLQGLRLGGFGAGDTVGELVIEQGDLDLDGLQSLAGFGQGGVDLGPGNFRGDGCHSRDVGDGVALFGGKNLGQLQLYLEFREALLGGGGCRLGLGVGGTGGLSGVVNLNKLHNYNNINILGGS